MQIRFKKLRDDAIAPLYAHGSQEDAGLDLFAVEETILHPNVPTLVKTGIALEIPPGYFGRILDRSGLALKHGIHVYAGVIDPAYRGEVGVVLVWGGSRPNAIHDGVYLHSFRGEDIPWACDSTSSMRYAVTPGERIAQLVIQRYVEVELVESESISDTERGAGGFGSTGK